MNLYLTGGADATALEEAADSLRTAGYDVTSPHEFEPAPDLGTTLERSIQEVLDADGVALLDGWESSGAATVEALTATSQGKIARPLRDWLAGIVAVLAILVGIGVGGALPASAGGDSSSEIIRAKRKILLEKRLERRLEKVQDLPTSPRTDWLEYRLEKRLDDVQEDVEQLTGTR